MLTYHFLIDKSGALNEITFSTQLAIHIFNVCETQKKIKNCLLSEQLICAHKIKIRVHIPKKKMKLCIRSSYQKLQNWKISNTVSHNLAYRIKLPLAQWQCSRSEPNLSYRCHQIVLLLEHNFVWWRNLDTSETRSGTPRKFWNVVLEKDREDLLGWSCY